MIVVSGLLRTKSGEVRPLRQYQTLHNIPRKTTHRRAAQRGFNPTSYTPHELGPMAGTVFECGRNKPAEEVTGHPTQKPEAIVEYLVLLASAPGDLVLDPFAGSGTVGVVALRHGRRFIGIELSPEYVQMARKRISGPLFAEANP
jgi:DNA modification methylase